MGFGSWIIDKSKAVQSACVDTVSQIETEVRALPARAKDLVKKAGKYFFSKGNVPSRKSIAETEWGKYLTKSEIIAYNEHVENFSQNRESTPAQIRAFIKVQSLREKVLAKQGNEITPLSKRESQATDSIIKDKKAREWNAQQKAYNYGMPVLNLISFGGAGHLEKARESVEKGKGLSAAGHTTVGLGLTAVGAYFTVAESFDLAYGGCKWLYRLSKGTLTKAPSVILSAAKTALKTVKNPKVVLESTKAASRAFSKTAGEIVGKASAGLKNLAAKKLTELSKTASAARSTLGSFRSVRTAGQTLESASGRLIESTGRLLSNIRANPQTYVLKAGAGALGIDWAGNAIKDFKEGHTGSGILNTAFALTAPGMVRFTTPALLASREKLSAINSAEIREFATQVTQKASRGISDICDKAVAFAKSLPETIKDIPQTLEAGASNIFYRPQLAGAGGYGNIPLNSTSNKLTRARVMLFAGESRGLTRNQIIQALHKYKGNRADAARELGVHPATLSRRAKDIRELPEEKLQKLAQESGLSAEQILYAVRDLNPKKGLTRSQIIQVLYKQNGNRTATAGELGVRPCNIGEIAEKVRELPEEKLQKLAQESGLSVEQILYVTRDLGQTKGLTHSQIVQALHGHRGHRGATAEEFGVHNSTISGHTENIRKLSEAELQKLAQESGLSVEQILYAVRDLDQTKGLTHSQIIQVLNKHEGNRVSTAKELGVNSGIISSRAKSTRELPEAELQKLAQESGLSVEQILYATRDLDPTKGLTHSQIVQALHRHEGHRTATLKELEIDYTTLRNHINNIKTLSDVELQKLAQESGLSVEQILYVTRDLGQTKGLTHSQIVNVLYKHKGCRTTAGEELGVSFGGLSFYSENIRELPEAELQKLAQESGLSVEQILYATRDLDQTKGLTHSQIIKTLHKHGGHRTDAAKELGIASAVMSQHAKNIRRFPEEKLQKLAQESGLSTEEIKQAVAPRIRSKRRLTLKRLSQIVTTLSKNDGNRIISAKELKIRPQNVSEQAKNIRFMPKTELQKLAQESGLSAEQILYATRDLDKTKGLTCSQIIQILHKHKGNRTATTKELDIADSILGTYIKKIRQLPKTELQKLAQESGLSIEEIFYDTRDLTMAKGLTCSQIIQILHKHKGNRTATTKELDIGSHCLSDYIKSIRELSEEKLKELAQESGISVEEIKQIVAPVFSKK